MSSALTLGGGPLALGQQDPGPRAGAIGAGGPLPLSTSDEIRFFQTSMITFQEVDSVSGTIPGESGRGLGPAFNANSCASCHAEPTVGGSSPGLNSPHNPVQNPQLTLATLDGATNTVPSFITAAGPMREARFLSDGGVHDLFTIKGRSDAGTCGLNQPNFAQALANNNVSFRIPTPLFGLGLVENTSDSELTYALARDQTLKAQYGIGGTFNTSGNDGTITRFGWKAQNKSLIVFAGEAYNVEQGVTNELFPNERNGIPGCRFNTSPEDLLNASSLTPGDTSFFAGFMRLSAPPSPGPSSSSTQNGQQLFSSLGCALCHHTTFNTGPSPYAGLNNVSYNPYSDFALHHMGTGLADGITQGNAGPDQFRTAPLWGVGQRLFFLHDGRTTDLLAAIEAHASSQSEANAVISNFNALNSSQKQDVLNFLRML